MNEDKFKRRVIAFTVGAVLLVIILVSVLFYQLISISVERKKLRQLDAKIIEYNQLKEDADKELEAYDSYWWIVQRARELGYSFDGEKLYK